MLFQEVRQPLILLPRPRVFALVRIGYRVYPPLLGHPIGLCTQGQGLHLGEVNETAVLLCPGPELIQVNHQKTVFDHFLCVDRKATVLYPAFHLVRMALRTSRYSQRKLVECHVVPTHQDRSQVKPCGADFDCINRPAQVLSNSWNGRLPPFFHEVDFFFGCPQSAARHVITPPGVLYFSRALVPYALFRAAKGGELNLYPLWRVFVVNGAVLVFAFIAAVLHDVSLRPGRLFHAASA